MTQTTTIRVRRETRDRINRLAGARGMSAPDLVGALVDRAEDDDLFARHATAYEELNAAHADLLREIAREDEAWDQADLSAPVDGA